MESGRRQKRVSEPHPISVDGFELIWEKRHPIFKEGRRDVSGVSLSVWIRPGKTKELVLDLHFASCGVERIPNAERWNPILAKAIRSAIEAGWDPESRGSAFRHTPE